MIDKKKIIIAFLLIVLCSVNAYAATESASYTQSIVSLRATKEIRAYVPGNSFAVTSESFSLESGETVTINASFSPSTASADFGLIDGDGIFHFFTATGGTANKTIMIDTRGNYTFAIRNNSSSAISVTGFVNY